ncbi:MAG: hypothetical protein HYU41_14915 [Candidatus Rokubacteria bacterium]|nr:hypothetical protein [Candidatus Rokubacteria bacterium]
MALRSQARLPSVPPPPEELAKAAERMQRIVDSLSLSSRPPTEKLETLDPAPLLTTVFAMLGFSARAASVHLTVDMPLRGLHLLGDRSLLLQVLANLGTAAVQAVGRGGLVTLAARPGKDREIILEVAFESGGRRGTLCRLSFPAARSAGSL